MAQEPQSQNHSGAGNEPAPEWDKLIPAISSNRTDRLLSARRAERGIEAPATASSALPDTSQPVEQDGAKAPSDATPWTAPLAAVAAPEGSASAPEATPAAERAEAREVAVDDKPRLLGLRRTIIALTVPVLTIMLAVRAVASPAFLWLEYHRPGFPSDSYGFDTQERLRLGSYGLDYILNFAPHTYLADITTGGNAAFLASEVEHMTDVKRVILISITFALIMLVLALLSARTLRLRAPGVLRSSLFTGAWLTLALLVGLGVAGAIGWEAFFTTFHEVFFPQGNWQFRMSDTLIRLYPPQFWVDAAATAGALTLLITVAVLAMTWPTRYRKQLALKRRAERQELKELLTK